MKGADHAAYIDLYGVKSLCQPHKQHKPFLWLLFILITPFGRSHSTCRQEMQTTAFVVVVYDCRVGIDAWYIDVFVVWISSVSFPDLHCKQSGNGTAMWCEQAVLVGMMTQVLRRSCSTCAMSMPTTRGGRSKCGHSRTHSSSSALWVLAAYHLLMISQWPDQQCQDQTPAL